MDGNGDCCCYSNYYKIFGRYKHIAACFTLIVFVTGYVLMVQTQFSSSSVAANAEVFVLPTSTVRGAITHPVTESGQAHRA